MYDNIEMDFSKGDGLLPVIIQHWQSGQVLMLGYMNAEALKKTLEEEKVTFFSRSKNRLWTKGEESGNFLRLKKLFPDCDQDTLLILAEPEGPTCHRGTTSCFDNDADSAFTADRSVTAASVAVNEADDAKGPKSDFIYQLEQIIAQRYEQPSESSYVNKLRIKGLNKIAQKVGEEATETVIAALAEEREDFLNESADLLFHLLMLLREKTVSLADISEQLRKRHK